MSQIMQLECLNWPFRRWVRLVSLEAGNMSPRPPNAADGQMMASRADNPSRPPRRAYTLLRGRTKTRALCLEQRQTLPVARTLAKGPSEKQARSLSSRRVTKDVGQGTFRCHAARRHGGSSAPLHSWRCH